MPSIDTMRQFRYYSVLEELSNDLFQWEKVDFLFRTFLIIWF
ncbi:hypothetical protein BN871_DB_00090 [Paenibacillus sp. P22]|nr:hypothetical protein BN871_DB_00090 [Paenibacillus sp. P22]